MLPGPGAPITAAGKITSPLGSQLDQIAKLVASNSTVQGNRQLFFASMGGFDTHGGQVITGSPTEGTHAGSLKGLGDAVTTFTQSDTSTRPRCWVGSAPANRSSTRCGPTS